ncbi:COMPASS (complex proteins associated with Set1p) component [Tilletia horrida]|uniref:COMPASS (Complex proteins associated with Set1p) component n=1 Tax=Tilletia horrida TaxID=155126 RepID=A0AAN6GIL1_9BASI|nr:COMPASS (complex proteins associated with Set1p) component [Tilletia horrida]
MTSRTAIAASLAEAAAAAARADAAVAARSSIASDAEAVDAQLFAVTLDAPDQPAPTSASAASAATAAAESASDTPADSASSAPPPAPTGKKKHPNQWTYRKKDPNKPHPNQYTYRPKHGKASVARPPPKKRSKTSRSRSVASDADDSIGSVRFAPRTTRRSVTPAASTSTYPAAHPSYSYTSGGALPAHTAESGGAQGFGISPPAASSAAAPAASGSNAQYASHASQYAESSSAGSSSAAAAIAAAEQAAAARAKAAEAKQKEKREKERERKRKAKEEEEAAAAAEEEAELVLDDKLYCICKTLYDEERMMIACDHCDEWYHTQCMGMSDAKAELVDMFVCPACEPLTIDRTTYKAKCLYTSCTHAALQPLSQFCSERCGILHAGAKIARGRFGRSNPVAASAALGFEKDVRPSMFGGGGVEKLLFSREVQSGKKREGMVVWADGAAESLPGWGLEAVQDDPDAQLHLQLADLRQRRAAVLRAQQLTKARLRLVGLAIKRADTIPSARPGDQAAGPDSADSPGATGASSSATANPISDPLYRNRNKKRKGADEVIEALVKNSWMRCGFDERLIWGDVRFAEWMNSSEGRAMLAGKVKLDGRVLDQGLDSLTYYSSTESIAGALPGVCGLAKRKCKRHSEWTAIRETDYNTELEEQANLLSRLTEEEDFVKVRLEKLAQRQEAERIIAASSDAATAAAVLRAARRSQASFSQ